MGSPVRVYHATPQAGVTPVQSGAVRSPRFRYTPHDEEQRRLLGSVSRPLCWHRVQRVHGPLTPPRHRVAAERAAPVAAAHLSCGAAWLPGVSACQLRQHTP